MDVIAATEYLARSTTLTSVGVIGYIIIGGLAGWIGSKIVKGSGSGILMDIVIGVVGSSLASPPQRWFVVWLGTANDPVDQGGAKALAESIQPWTAAPAPAPAPGAPGAPGAPPPGAPPAPAPPAPAPPPGQAPAGEVTPTPTPMPHQTLSA